jgi:hypothetical protein
VESLVLFAFSVVFGVIGWAGDDGGNNRTAQAAHLNGSVALTNRFMSPGTGESTMLELLRHEPWLIVVSLGLLIPIFGIVFGTTTNYLARVRQAELEASLKQNMLERGMTAEEIRTVIEATSRGKGKTCMPDSAVRQSMRQEMS